jgi:hypothetical protein
VQYAIGLRSTMAQDEIILPLNIAAHAGGGLQRRSRRADQSYSSLIASVGASGGSMSPQQQQQLQAWVAHESRKSTAVSNDHFSLVFVTSDFPCAAFTVLASNMAEFVTRRAIGISSQVIRISALPRAARRLAVYIFLLDSPESVDAFYRRVHCLAPHVSPLLANDLAHDSGGAGAASAAAPSRTKLEEPWPTCQVVVVCHTEVLKSGRVAGTQAGGGAGSVTVHAAPSAMDSARSILVRAGSGSMRSLRSVMTATTDSMRSVMNAISPSSRRRLRLSPPRARSPQGMVDGESVSLRIVHAASAAADSHSALIRKRWREAIRSVVRALPTSARPMSGTPLLFDLAASGSSASAPPADTDLPITGHDGSLSPHLRTVSN